MAKKLPIKMVEVMATAPTDDIKLVGPALKLYEDVTKAWKLDAVAERLLLLACQNVQSANQCAAIVEREGLTVVTPAGKVEKHPASVMMRDFASNAAQTLQKLSLSLG